MNAYKLNGSAGFLFRSAVCRKLNIRHTEIYKKVKEINGEIIVDKDGKKYRLELIQFP